jgi:predicted kinase
VVTGPPAAGKTTWVREHAKPGDITIDYDALIGALTPRGTEPYDAPMHIVDVAQTARNAAIHVALNKLWHCNIYIIDSKPNDQARQRYERLDAQFVNIDPGYEACMGRARSERHPRIQQAIETWYSSRVAHR